MARAYIVAQLRRGTIPTLRRLHGPERAAADCAGVGPREIETTPRPLTMKAPAMARAYIVGS